MPGQQVSAQEQWPPSGASRLGIVYKLACLSASLGAVCQNCGQVAHCASGHQQSGLFAQQFGSVLLQPVYAEVFTIYVVAYLSLGQTSGFSLCSAMML